MTDFFLIMQGKAIDMSVTGTGGPIFRCIGVLCHDCAVYLRVGISRIRQTGAGTQRSGEQWYGEERYQTHFTSVPRQNCGLSCCLNKRTGYLVTCLLTILTVSHCTKPRYEAVSPSYFGRSARHLPGPGNGPIIPSGNWPLRP